MHRKFTFSEAPILRSSKASYPTSVEIRRWRAYVIKLWSLPLSAQSLRSSTIFCQQLRWLFFTEKRKLKSWQNHRLMKRFKKETHNNEKQNKNLLTSLESKHNRRAALRTDGFMWRRASKESVDESALHGHTPLGIRPPHPPVPVYINVHSLQGMPTGLPAFLPAHSVGFSHVGKCGETVNLKSTCKVCVYSS